MRMALALNSAVPDFGSVASMVRTLVETSSGKCSVMNARPGRSDGSMPTSTSTEPRRELAFTRSPSSTPSRLPSSGALSSASPLRSGDVYWPDWTPVLNDSGRRSAVGRRGRLGRGGGLGPGVVGPRQQTHRAGLVRRASRRVIAHCVDGAQPAAVQRLVHLAEVPAVLDGNLDVAPCVRVLVV